MPVSGPQRRPIATARLAAAALVASAALVLVASAASAATVNILNAPPGSAVLNADLVVNKRTGFPIDTVQQSCDNSGATGNFCLVTNTAAPLFTCTIIPPPALTPPELPDSGVFAADANHPFAVDLPYDNEDDGLNALRLPTVSTTPVTVSVPIANYSALHFFWFEGDAGTTRTVTVTATYTDLTTTVATVSPQDWFFDPPPAGMYYLIDGLDRVRPDASNCEVRDDPAIFGYPFPVVGSKQLQSITLTPGAGAAVINIMGITGTTIDTDLALTKSDAPDPVVVGNTITYTLTVTASGAGGSLTGVSVTDTLPVGTDLRSATPSVGTCTLSGATATCALGTMATGTSATVTITATADLGGAGTVTNRASVSTTGVDVNPANNTASATTTIVDPHAVLDSETDAIEAKLDTDIRWVDEPELAASQDAQVTAVIGNTDTRATAINANIDDLETDVAALEAKFDDMGHIGGHLHEIAGAVAAVEAKLDDDARWVDEGELAASQDAQTTTIVAEANENQAAIAAVEAKLDDASRWVSDADLAASQAAQTAAIDADTDAATGAAIASVNGHVDTTVGAATTTIVAEINDNEAAIAALEAKADSGGGDTSAIAAWVKRWHIEMSLLEIDRVSFGYLPDLSAGNLELVRDIVSETITQHVALGLDVRNGPRDLADGDAARARGAFKSAWDDYSKAYRQVVLGHD